MNKRLNIAVFTDSFFPGSGGTEVATYQLCKTLKDNGHNILLFAPDYHKHIPQQNLKLYASVVYQSPKTI